MKKIRDEENKNLKEDQSYGLETRKNNTWNKRKNEGLKHMTDAVLKTRLKFSGHITRMREHIIKKVYHKKIDDHKMC